MLKVLLVEDEVHKRDELSQYLREVGEMELSFADSVRSAVIAVGSERFDLIVLDMALPTFSTGTDGADGGLDQALGGIEVLRTLRMSGTDASIIIVTQYPDISVDGKRRIKLKDAKMVLGKRYGLNVIGAVLYSYKSPQNKSRLLSALEQRS